MLVEGLKAFEADKGAEDGEDVLAKVPEGLNLSAPLCEGESLLGADETAKGTEDDDLELVKGPEGLDVLGADKTAEGAKDGNGVLVKGL